MFPSFLSFLLIWLGTAFTECCQSIVSQNLGGFWAVSERFWLEIRLLRALKSSIEQIKTTWCLFPFLILLGTWCKSRLLGRILKRSSGKKPSEPLIVHIISSYGMDLFFQGDHWLRVLLEFLSLILIEFLSLILRNSDVILLFMRFIDTSPINSLLNSPRKRKRFIQRFSNFWIILKYHIIRKQSVLIAAEYNHELIERHAELHCSLKVTVKVKNCKGKLLSTIDYYSLAYIIEVLMSALQINFPSSSCIDNAQL